MSAPRDDRPTDYVQHEIDAFVALHTVPPGTRLSALITMGLIDDTGAVLDEPPVIDKTDLVVDVFPYHLEDENNHGAVGQTIYLVGQRMSMAFGTESGIGVGPALNLRRLGYAPPIVRFGTIATVPELSPDFQGYGPGSVYWYAGCPANIMKVKIPPGAGTPVTLTVRGHTVTAPSFTVDGDVFPNPGRTPFPPQNLTCVRGIGGTADLQWTPPSQYANGTPINTSHTRALVFRNGFQIADLSPTTGTFHDPVAHDYWETSLYQVILVDNDPAASGPQEGVPSTVCQTAARHEGPEVTIFVLDRSNSMNYVGYDGISRFERILGPLPASAVPRAFQAAQEVFSGTYPPIVAVYSFNSHDGLIDEVSLLTGSTFTSSYTYVMQALAAVQGRGATQSTPLLDTVCVSASNLLAEFQANPAGTATLRVFTDGEENFSIGVPDCPVSCQTGLQPPYVADWDLQCRPGTCPGSPYDIQPIDCTTCQVDLFNQYCTEPVNYFVEYFGRDGPFSPLPPDAGFFMDLARATEGRFIWNTDVGGTAGSVPGDMRPIADAGESLQIQCSGPYTPYYLAGNAYDELPPDQLDFTWTGPFPEGGGVLNQPWGAISLPVGSNVLELVVADEHQHSRASVAQIDVIDTEAPTVTGYEYTGPTCLWPPNHKYAVLRVGRDFQAAVSDACDASPSLTITGVTSSQPDNSTGDGNTYRDAVVFPDRICLRSERRGQEQEGRQYEIEIRAMDAAGNQTEAYSASIRVAHDQSDRDCRPENLELVDEDDPTCDPLASISLVIGTAQGNSGCNASGSQPSFPAVLLFLCLLVFVLVTPTRRRR
jgi:hypothetical protein